MHNIVVVQSSDLTFVNGREIPWLQNLYVWISVIINHCGLENFPDGRISHAVTSEHRTACRPSCKVLVVIVWSWPKLECIDVLVSISINKHHEHPSSFSQVMCIQTWIDKAVLIRASQGCEHNQNGGKRQKAKT